MNSQSGTLAEYSEYCEARGVTEETFNFPDFKDGTIANNPVGSGEANGLYKLDAIKNHPHTMVHDHDMSHEHDIEEMDFSTNFDGEIGGAGNVPRTNNVKAFDENKKTTGGRDRTGASSTPNTGEAGDSDRTQMRHTLVQFYILAKFLG